MQIIFFLMLSVILIIAVRYPRFRMGMGLTLLILVVGIGLVVWMDNQERAFEWQRVSPSEVQLSHVEVRAGLNSRSFVVNGRLQNDSKEFTVTLAVLELNLEDCHGLNPSECELIGQERAELPLEVPSGQARDFRVTVPFSTVPHLQGSASWNYEIIRVRAR